jgi:hypothetical protein
MFSPDSIGCKALVSVSLLDACPASALLRQIGWLEEGRISGSSFLSGEAQMRQKSETTETTSEQVVKNIRRATRKHHSAEEKIRIVLDGLRGE